MPRIKGLIMPTPMRHKTNAELAELNWKFVARNKKGEAASVCGDQGSEDWIKEWLAEGYTVTEISKVDLHKIPDETEQPMDKDALKLIDQRIGRNIRETRLARQLTQTDVAQKCKVSFQQIQKYEIGSNRAAGSRLVQLAGILNTTPAALMDQSNALR
jgi:ribosome-binding protein aMBF1 (putative translation factor)